MFRKDQNYSLSAEQKDKLSRKKNLQIALSKVEQLLVRYSLRDQKEDETPRTMTDMKDLATNNVSELKPTSNPTSNPTVEKRQSKKGGKFKQPTGNSVTRQISFADWDKMVDGDKDNAVNHQVVVGLTDSSSTVAALSTFQINADEAVKLQDIHPTPRVWKNDNSVSYVPWSIVDGVRKTSSSVSLVDILKEEEAKSAQSSKMGSAAEVLSVKATVPLSQSTSSGRTVLSPKSTADCPTWSSPALLSRFGSSDRIASIKVTPQQQKKHQSDPTIPLLSSTTKVSSLSSGQRKGYDLTDFFVSASVDSTYIKVVDSVSSSNRSNIINSSCVSKPPTSMWATTPIDTIVDGVITKQNESDVSTTKASRISFSAIQEEEERVKKNSNMASLKGNELCPWLLERRPRAESLEEVIKRQTREKEEEMEIQREIKKFEEMERDAKRKHRARRPPNLRK